MKIRILFAVLTLILATSICPAKDEVRADFKKYFDEYNLVGAFVLYDTNGKNFIRYNPERARQRFIPASTFKIANSLIGLETGVIADENFIFKWDGKPRTLKTWEKDFDLKGAFQASCVPCYQELARLIGTARMQRNLNKLNYGNKNISGGIDQFWLTGGLRISPDEEVNFLRRLYAEKLSVSKRSQAIVKRIMLREEKPNYKIYGKTGWQTDDLSNPNGKYSIGWFVGFLEQNGNVYFFATNVETPQTQDNFAAARTEITSKILKDLKLL